MTEKVLAQIYRDGQLVAMQDITNFTVDQISDLVKLENILGRTVVWKRYGENEDPLAAAKGIFNGIVICVMTYILIGMAFCL